MPKVQVNQDLCIACQNCIQQAPKSFRSSDNGKTEGINPPGDDLTVLQTAVDSCPVGAISLIKEE
jgi:ferredoxin